MAVDNEAVLIFEYIVVEPSLITSCRTEALQIQLCGAFVCTKVVRARIEFTVDSNKTAIIFALSQRERVTPLVTEQKPCRFISVGLLYVQIILKICFVSGPL